jgi:hypothetical protein
MIRTFVLAPALLLGACATVSNAPPSPPAARSQATAGPAAGLSPQQVSQGFVEAVVQGCAAAAEAGKPISEVAGTVIVRDDGRSAGGMKPRNGGEPWAPASAKGIVMIDAAPTECEVGAYGPPAQATLVATGEALVAKGFAVASPMTSSGGIFFVKYSKQAGGRTVAVDLTGNEPGAPGMRSRFSTLTAKVTAK